MTRTRGIEACVAVACQVGLGCSGEGPSFDDSARGGDITAARLISSSGGAGSITRREDIGGTGGLPPASPPPEPEETNGARVPGPPEAGSPEPGTPVREGRDSKTSFDHERAALFSRAKALNVCASTLGDGSMHTVVQCPRGMQYDHGAEQCFRPKYEPSPAGVECRNGEDRCFGAAKQACASGRWSVLETYSSGAACEEGLRADHMKMLQ